MAALIILAIAAAATAALALCSATALRLWYQWLDLKRLEHRRGHPTAPARLELADLKHRVRRLESIANGER